jgi:hypothetical protein
MESNITEHFDRGTVEKLTGVTRRQMETMVKNGFVKPYTRTDYIRSKWLFSWEQLLEIKAIAKLRSVVSSQKLCLVKSFLQELGCNDSLCNNAEKVIVATNKKVFLIDNNQDVIIELIGKSKGQIILGTLLVSDLINEVQSKARQESMTCLSTQLERKVA